jgi:hypothetical protein
MLLLDCQKVDITLTGNVEAMVTGAAVLPVREIQLFRANGAK